MTSKLYSSYGGIRIEDQVIERIASQTAMECYGVVGLAAPSKKDNFFRLLRREDMTRGVKVFSTGENSVILQLSVIMDADVRFSMVAENVIDTVRYHVESQTGVRVESVDVVVQGIRV